VRFGERFVGGDRDCRSLFSFGENLEQQLGAAPVKFHVAEFIEAEQIDSAATPEHN